MSKDKLLKKSNLAKQANPFFYFIPLPDKGQDLFHLLSVSKYTGENGWLPLNCWKPNYDISKKKVALRTIFFCFLRKCTDWEHNIVLHLDYVEEKTLFLQSTICVTGSITWSSELFCLFCMRILISKHLYKLTSTNKLLVKSLVMTVDTDRHS